MKKIKIEWNWIIKISLLSLIISMVFSTVSEVVISNVNILISFIITILFIAIGVVFDMIGVAVTSADEAPFHAMASRKIHGAKKAISLKKNASKVSSFCNDVIGDICGIVSGSTGAVIALGLSSKLGVSTNLINIVTMGFISALTIGGKAIFKTIAIKNSNQIIFKFAKILSFFS
jgi:CBS domain containing-hemolysin-like protein